MRIVIINQHRDDVLGGSEIQCDLIAKGLRQRGHEVSYVAPNGRVGRDYGREYSILPVPMARKVILSTVLAERPDVVYWRFNTNGLLSVARSLNKAGVPIVMAVSALRDTSPWPVWWSNSGWKTRLTQLGRSRRLWLAVRGWIEFQGTRYVDAVTYLNPDLAGRFPRKREFVVHNAMSEESAPFEWPRPFCAWIANLKAGKRPEAFVALASEFMELGVDCLMVGSQSGSGYRWIAEETATPANFHYLGQKSPEEVNGILAKSLFHVHTCRPEGFGNVFIQAWLQGRASLSLGYDPGGYLAAESIGFNAGDDWQKFVSVAREWACGSGCKEHGAKARAFATARFSPERLVGDVERVLGSVVNASGSRIRGRQDAGA